MTTKKRHTYVGYEGTCLDCNLDLDDTIHIRRAEREVPHGEPLDVALEKARRDGYRDGYHQRGVDDAARSGNKT